MKVTANKNFKGKFLRQTFFIRYDDVDLSKLDYSILTIPFIMNVISTVWVSGNHYSIDVMDEDLYYSLKRLNQVFKVMYPKTKWDGELIPKTLKNNRLDVKPKTDQIALLFSNGLDSVFSSLMHRDEKQLLITGWGQVDIPLSNKSLWQKRKQEMIDFGERYGHENTFLQSNFSNFRNHKKLRKLAPDIYEWRKYAVEDIGWIGLATPILFTKGIDILYIASSRPWSFGYARASNPFIDRNISIAGISFVPDQYDHLRQDKIQGLSRIRKELPLDTLIIKACDSISNTNCCKCSKCLQTALGFIALGENPRDYGFNDPIEKIMQRVRALDVSKLSLSTRWRYKKIRECIEKNNNTELKEAFRWLFETNLEENIENAPDTRNQVMTDWKKLSELFPAIQVPAWVKTGKPRNIWGEPLNE